MYTLCQTISRFRTDSELIENLEKNDDHLEILAKNFLPSGSGFDAGCRILEVSKNRIKIQCDFHHMDENGFYCGWSEHIATITPSFDGFDIRLSGRNFRDIKNYIGEMLHNALTVKIQLHWNKEDKMFSFSEVA